jgi:hypothetical protein
MCCGVKVSSRRPLRPHPALDQDADAADDGRPLRPHPAHLNSALGALASCRVVRCVRILPLILYATY